MPSKRRTPAKAPAPAAAKATTAAAPSKDVPLPSTKAVPAPTPQPSPPLPQPIDTPASKVRREWERFIGNWYEPQKKKLEEQLHKELATKYKKSGSSKAQQKARDSELQQKLTQLAEQLAEPARSEWEKRLEAAHLREDQWIDMTLEEQRAVLSVFIGFFGDEEDEDVDEDGKEQQPSTAVSSVEEDEDQSKGLSLFGSTPSPLPNNATFELVNPSSLFVETASPLNPTKKLPALSMDHLATLGTSNGGRPTEPLLMTSAAGGGFGFQNWASEAGLASQQSQPASQASKPTQQTLGVRPRATDNISRQASAVSTVSSPPLFSNKSSPPQQTSPPIQTSKASPPASNDTLPLGKRYIGPTILDDDEPLDEDLLKSKMAAEYEEFKNSLRIQMIYDFHAEAAEIEIKLVETLLADNGTKESRAKAVQEHELNMMALREQKEEERKRRCAEERERRREQHRAYLTRAANRSTQNRDIDPSGSKGAPLKSSDKSTPQKGLSIVQKEHPPAHQSTSASSLAPKFEPAGILKKSSSVLSQAEASSNEAIFAGAAAFMAQGKLPGDGLNVPQPPQIRQRTNSTRSVYHDIPQITVNLAEPSDIVPSAPAPTSGVKGKKTKKGQTSHAKPVMLNEGLDVDAEPPPPPSPWGAPASKSAWGTSSSSQSKRAAVSEESDVDAGLFSSFTSSLTSALTGTTKAGYVTSEKKSKTVTFTDEPDIEFDAPPVSAWESKAPKGAWGSVNGKQKKRTGGTAEEQKQPGPAPTPAPSSTAKKSAKAPSTSTTNKNLKAAAVSEEMEGVEEDVVVAPAPTPQQTKTAWGPAPGKQTKATAPQTGAQPRRGMEPSVSKSARVATVLDIDDNWGVGANGRTGASMPGALEEVETSDESDEDDDTWLDKENVEYWNNFIGFDHEKPLAEPSTGAVKHVRWTPAVPDHDSDEEDESGGFGDEFAGELWMQYAISGGEMPCLGVPTAESEVAPPQKTQPEMSVWEAGKAKKEPIPNTGKAAFQAAAWPKMENWLSPTSRVGQSAGSTRFF
ncbi:hypothetical protein ID866_3769 [Astraeus odoratus]|nr:hypothetical protein ID866_3769 [Astraeus odoratus]